MNNEKMSYEELELAFALLKASLAIPEVYYGIVSEQVASELELTQHRLREATKIIRSLEYSVVYDWGDEFTSPKPPVCPFCAVDEGKEHKDNCSIGNFLSGIKVSI